MEFLEEMHVVSFRVTSASRCHEGLAPRSSSTRSLCPEVTRARLKTMLSETPRLPHFAAVLWWVAGEPPLERKVTS